MRVTWIQPEDLVGHELRQAREEGKDIDSIEQLPDAVLVLVESMLKRAIALNMPV